jgi:dTDP-glucose 4,6-dehydratase
LRWSYSEAKAIDESLAYAYYVEKQLETRIVRFFNTVGPRQLGAYGMVVPRFVKAALANEPITIYGDGKQIREWIHVDDHCRGVATVLEKGKSGEIYNIAGTDEFENIELARKIIAYFGKSEEEAFEFVTDRKGHDMRYSLTGNKIRIELGVQPQIDFKTGLRATIDWYVANEYWWRPLLKK